MSKLMRQAALAENNELLLRATAAVAAARPALQSPRQWVQDRAYQLAVTDEWSELSTISDAAIVARVRQLLGIDETAPPEAPPEEVPDA